MKNIISFYSKAKAFDNLAMFNALEKILDKYLDEVITVNDRNNYKEITRDSKFINKKDLSYNRFLDNYASFSYY